MKLFRKMWYILVPILSVLFLYLLFSFTALDLDFRNWRENMRLVFAMTGCVVFAVAVMYSDAKLKSCEKDNRAIRDGKRGVI
jgi:4-amino-4-deoxy-L-arabinose transferase-like glycosyltransferase